LQAFHCKKSAEYLIKIIILHKLTGGQLENIKKMLTYLVFFGIMVVSLPAGKCGVQCPSNLRKKKKGKL